MQETDTMPVRGVFGRLVRELSTTLVNPLIAPRRLDDYLELINPSWSVEEVRATVVELKRETPDVTSLSLKPNVCWQGHRAGQHVTFTVSIDGVRHTRCFSISNAPGGLLRFTIKAHEGGVVSKWAQDTARVGDVVVLSEARGSFVLPEKLPSKLLFISGGSGLTPLVAMAQQLVTDRYDGSLTWLHFERSDVPLENELHELAHSLRAQLYVRRTGARLAHGVASVIPRASHLDGAQLAQLVPDWAERELFLCGPQPLMDEATRAFSERGLQARVHSERFRLVIGKPAIEDSTAAAAQRSLVFVRSKRQSAVTPGVSLLEQAEQAGLRPKHGCRMGICHTCTCTKLSGTVRNELTGSISDAADEEIQLCIHTPLSNVSLDL